MKIRHWQNYSPNAWKSQRQLNTRQRKHHQRQQKPRRNSQSHSCIAQVWSCVHRCSPHNMVTWKWLQTCTIHDRESWKQLQTNRGMGMGTMLYWYLAMWRTNCPKCSHSGWKSPYTHEETAHWHICGDTSHKSLHQHIDILILMTSYAWTLPHHQLLHHLCPLLWANPTDESPRAVVAPRLRRSSDSPTAKDATGARHPPGCAVGTSSHGGQRQHKRLKSLD